ncbi:MAG: hypothetical protein LAO78_14765 [Acidobacteriia bacterium]|nr:hypothetical protein [Terriglobia bacterium]
MPELAVLPVDEVVVLGDVEAAVLPLLVLLAGVHGATVELVPVVPPVTDPAWPATPGVPCVTEGEPVELVPGCDVCKVPMDPVVPDVEVVPEGVDVVPCGVEVVPGWVCVVGVPVCGPMPGLGVTVPVFCAEAMPIDSANTYDANKIFCIEDCSS